MTGAADALPMTGGTGRRFGRRLRSIWRHCSGEKLAGSVTKKTSYLVAGADTGKTKLETAEKLGVQVIGEAELEVLLGG